MKHFGDQADPGTACGLCDICLPDGTVAGAFDAATPQQQAAMERILKTLNDEGTPSSGRLHAALFGEDFDRSHFEDLLSALFRAGFIHLEEESFESEGRTIEFRRPVITPAGRRADADEIAALRVPSRAEARKSKRAARRKKTSRSKKKTGSKRKRSARKKLDLAVTASPRLLESLRAFRLKEARIRNIPAFRIFSDRVMAAIANERPQMAADLLAINGVGATLHKRYGERILQIVAEN